MPSSGIPARNKSEEPTSKVLPWGLRLGWPRRFGAKNGSWPPVARWRGAVGLACQQPRNGADRRRHPHDRLNHGHPRRPLRALAPIGRKPLRSLEDGPRLLRRLDRDIRPWDRAPSHLRIVCRLASGANGSRAAERCAIQRLSSQPFGGSVDMRPTTLHLRRGATRLRRHQSASDRTTRTRGRPEKRSCWCRSAGGSHAADADTAGGGSLSEPSDCGVNAPGMVRGMRITTAPMVPVAMSAFLAPMRLAKGPIMA